MCLKEPSDRVRLTSRAVMKIGGFPLSTSTTRIACGNSCVRAIMDVMHRRVLRTHRGSSNSGEVGGAPLAKGCDAFTGGRRAGAVAKGEVAYFQRRCEAWRLRRLLNGTLE